RLVAAGKRGSAGPIHGEAEVPDPADLAGWFSTNQPCNRVLTCYHRTAVLDRYSASSRRSGSRLRSRAPHRGRSAGSRTRRSDKTRLAPARMAAIPHVGGDLAVKRPRSFSATSPCEGRERSISTSEDSSPRAAFRGGHRSMSPGETWTRAPRDV